MKKITFITLSIVLNSFTNAQTVNIEPSKEKLNDSVTVYRYANLSEHSILDFPIRVFNPAKLVKFSKKFIGTPYLLGGNTPSGFDCSGFVTYLFKHYAVFLPHFSNEQAELGKLVSKNEAKQGDMIFFRGSDLNNPKVDHAGIVVRKEKNDIVFIHASTSKGVRESKLSNKYFNDRFILIKRFITN